MAEVTAAKPKRTRRRRRRTSRFSRPVALILQAGAVAGAIASISGIVIGGVHLLDGGHSKASTGAQPGPHPDRVRLTAGAVHSTTGKLALQAAGTPTGSTPKDILEDTGVTVDYDFTAPGYKPGTEFPLRFIVYGKQPGGVERVVTRGADTARVQPVESDPCGCVSPFISLPRGRAHYRVEIQVFQPGGKTTEPLRRKSTKPFVFD
ncbi:MAG TPA: hypothetical protein VF066_18285 [Thermoleophilaceae bacterium]